MASTKGAALPLGSARITTSARFAATACGSRLSYRSSPAQAPLWASTRCPSSSREETKASWSDGCAAIKRINSAPVWPRAPTMPTVFMDVFMSVDKRRPALRTMRNTAGDDLEIIAQAVPENPEPLFLETTFGLLVIERVDAVAVAGTPEQLRIFRAHDLPCSAAQTLALRLVQHCELVEVGQAVFHGQDHRRAVILAHVHAVRPRALEVISGQMARCKAGIDQRAHAVLVDTFPRFEAQHLLAPPHQRAGAPVGEQFLGQFRRPRNRHRRRERQVAQQVRDLLQFQAHAA